MDGVTLICKKQLFRNSLFWLSVTIHFNQWLNTPAHEIYGVCISSVLNDLCLLGPSDMSAIMKFSRRPTCPDASVAANLPTPPVPRHRKSHSLGNKWVPRAGAHRGRGWRQQQSTLPSVPSFACIARARQALLCVLWVSCWPVATFAQRWLLVPDGQCWKPRVRSALGVPGCAWLILFFFYFLSILRMCPRKLLSAWHTLSFRKAVNFCSVLSG